MNRVKLDRAIILMLLFLCILQFNCKNKKREKNQVDYQTETGIGRDFGRTAAVAYTPEIREHMEKLYEDKFGLFVHFGPYAQLEGMWKGEEVAAEWIMKRASIPVKEYEMEASGKFKPEKFSAKQWVDVAKSAGMKFMVVTAKHHDGFAMYKSGNPYNLNDFAGFERDILKELSEECVARDMDLGFYYSQSQDWHEEGAFGNTWDFNKDMPQEKFDAYFNEKVIPQVKELTTNYGDVFMMWFDTPAGMQEYQSEALMDVIKNNQPGALVNSRLGNGYGHFDVSIDNGKTPSVSTSSWLPDLKIPWQSHGSVTEKGWGYTKYGSEKNRSGAYVDFIYNLCRIVGNGGVYLLNVAPSPDGTIPPSQVNSLQAIGEWLEVNGESIYGADPSPLKFPPFAITSQPNKLYLHIKNLDNLEVELNGILSNVKKAYCLADKEKNNLAFTQSEDTIKITIPEVLKQPRVTVVVLEIEDEIAKVVDETLQQQKDGTIKLPVEKSEFEIRRMSYNYEEKVTHRWGENPKQGLIWTVNITQPGLFKIISEDNADADLQYKLKTLDDTHILNAKGELDIMSKKVQNTTIRIDKIGVQKIQVHPFIGSKNSSRYKFKGLELIRIE
ncbi:alpha-L-fucosidase [Mariniflexile sp. AS56]|uniref:alpha-L-fucosidase n=1 Tax=Mariniflexile sp. AS56 TaxID=3063957 RepID=UPI0026EF9B44|nr:alpha-L-fucosidase [Mariniflexile sp. AS56]MDO7172394.1 alpha-L-fucosidase [Mariniflexile sp. AS56]